MDRLMYGEIFHEVDPKIYDMFVAVMREKHGSDLPPQLEAKFREKLRTNLQNNINHRKTHVARVKRLNVVIAATTGGVVGLVSKLILYHDEMKLKCLTNQPPIDETGNISDKVLASTCVNHYMGPIQKAVELGQIAVRYFK